MTGTPEKTEKTEKKIITAEDIIKNLAEKHNTKIELTHDIGVLIRYTFSIGYNYGCVDGKRDADQKHTETMKRIKCQIDTLNNKLDKMNSKY